MDLVDLDKRLSKGGWTEKALNRLVAEVLFDDQGQVDLTVLSALAAAVRLRAADGAAKEAARLAVITLNAAEPIEASEEETEEETRDRETRRWVRYALCAMLRDLPTTKKALLGLRPLDRKAVQAADLPASPESLVDQASDSAAVSETISGVHRQDALPLIEMLWAVRAATRDLTKRRDHGGAINVARAGLELVETARISNETLQAIVEEYRQDIGRALTSALSSFDPEEAARKDLLDWLMRSKAGEPRLLHVAASLGDLAPRDREELLARMRKKATKSNSFRRALVEVGAGLLSPDDYLALCRELHHPAGIVSVLLDRGQVEEAAEEAAKAIAEDDERWPIAKRFHDLGRTDLAIEVLRPVSEATVNSELELWLAEQLEARGDEDEAVKVYRRRFVKRPALPQFQALRERVSGKAWKRLRQELIAELSERRLHRPLLDIAFDEEDTDLLAAIAPELDDDQAVHAEHVLRTWQETFDGPTPKVDAVLAKLESRRSRREPTAPEVVAAAPVPKRVKHKKFGEGEVVNWSGEGDQLKLEIEFEGTGKKVLLARFVEFLG